MKHILRSLIVGIAMAFSEMMQHRLRSALSMIGIMLGVASLVIMLTLVGGIKTFLNEQMGRWAGTVFIYQSENPTKKELSQWSRSPGMKYSDGSVMKKSVSEIGSVVNCIDHYGKAIISGESVECILRGVDSSALSRYDKDIGICAGRNITSEEYKNGTEVALLSWSKVHEVIRAHPSESAESIVGKSLRMGDKLYKIVGVFSPRMTGNEDWYLAQSVFVPIKSMRGKFVSVDPNPQVFQVIMKSPMVLAEGTAKLTALLTGHHRGVKDFITETPDWFKEIKSMLDNISVLMTIIAALSLFVGGLSIMNVMLSSVAERVYEIGIRMALGARPLDIAVQFIAESLTLSSVGGMIGGAIGLIPLLFGEVIYEATDHIIRPTILLPHALAVMAIVSGIGIFFGLYPAIRASRMSPVEALRYE